jgi:hypothetical protein
LTDSLYHALAEVVVSGSQCVEAPSGIISIANFKCGLLKVHAAVVRRHVTAVSDDTRLSTVAMLTINETCTQRLTSLQHGWQQHAVGKRHVK